MNAKHIWLAFVLLFPALARSQIYTINIVGFVNVPMRQGWTLTANPLVNSNNSATVIMPLAPDGTTIHRFDPVTQTYSNAATFFAPPGPGWYAASGNASDLILNPGEAFWVESPQAWVNTFVGGVVTGTSINPIPTNFSLRASIIPQSGWLASDLQFPAQPSTRIYKWDGATFAKSVVDPEFLSWDPDEPSITVAEGFIVWTESPADWTRTFVIGPAPRSLEDAASTATVKSISATASQVTLHVNNPDASLFNVQYSTDRVTWKTIAYKQSGSLWKGPKPDSVRGYYQLTTP